MRLLVTTIWTSVNFKSSVACVPSNLENWNLTPNFFSRMRTTWGSRSERKTKIFSHTSLDQPNSHTYLEFGLEIILYVWNCEWSKGRDSKYLFVNREGGSPNNSERSRAWRSFRLVSFDQTYSDSTKSFWNIFEKKILRVKLFYASEKWKEQ